MTQFIEAEAQIRQLHAHYTDAVWRKDLDAFGDCFMPDAEWRIAGRLLCGRADIVAGFAAILPTCNRVLISFRNAQVEVVGPGEATARVYVTEQCSWTDKPGNMNIGRYFDRAVADGNRWRFSWRLFQLLYS